MKDSVLLSSRYTTPPRPIGHGGSVMHARTPLIFIQPSILSGVSPATSSFFQSVSVYIHVWCSSSYLALTTDTSCWRMPLSFFFLSFVSSLHFRGRWEIKSEFAIDSRYLNNELYSHLCKIFRVHICPVRIVRTWFIGIWHMKIRLLRSVS